MAPGWQQLLIVLVLVLVLFGGRGRISSLMGDMAKGIKSFKKGLQDEEGGSEEESPRAANLSHQPPTDAEIIDTEEPARADRPR